jgi:ribokinase
VLVVGAINTDLVIVAPRLPTPGETVIGGGLQTFGGGKGANAAVAASRAGADVLLIGAVGADSSGTDAIAALRGDGVDTSGVAVLDAEPTGAALIVVDPRGENQITIGPGANGAVSAAHVRASLAAALPTADVVLVSTEIPLAAVAAAIEASAAAGVTCILNPAPVIAGLPGLLSFRPMLTPNELELRALVSGLSSGRTSASTAAAGDGMPAHLNALGERTRAPVIVTLGGEGCAVRLPGGELRRIPAHPVADVVDTTGAGDTFNGVFAARLASGDALTTAVETAIVAASLSVTAIGARAGMPTAAAIDRAIHPTGS